METKVCAKCKKEKYLDFFYKNRNRNNSPSSKCKKCLKSIQRNQYKRCNEIFLKNIILLIYKLNITTKGTMDVVAKSNGRDGIIINRAGHKRCSKCLKTVSVNSFHHRKNGLNGLSSFCKLCKSNIDSLYRKENKESLAVKNAAYYQKNKERISEWYSLNNEHILEVKKNHYYNNIRKYRQWKKQNYKKNRTREIAMGFFYRVGLKKRSIPTLLLNLKEKHILLKRALKSSQSA